VGISIEITDSAYAFNPVSTIWKWANFLAQVANVRIDAAIERREVTTENVTRQLISPNNLTGLAQKHFQQIELHCR
jgi:hypothetical protein